MALSYSVDVGYTDITVTVSGFSYVNPNYTRDFVWYITPGGIYDSYTETGDISSTSCTYSGLSEGSTYKLQLKIYHEGTSIGSWSGTYTTQEDPTPSYYTVTVNLGEGIQSITYGSTAHTSNFSFVLEEDSCFSLTCAPKTGYDFKNWTYTTPYGTYTTTERVFNFYYISYNVSITANGSVSGPQFYPYDAYVYDGGWKKAIPYVFNGSTWLPARTPYIFEDRSE